MLHGSTEVILRAVALLSLVYVKMSENGRQSIKTSFEATTLLKQNLEDKREEQSSRQSEYREPNEPADKEAIFFCFGARAHHDDGDSLG